MLWNNYNLSHKYDNMTNNEIVKSLMTRENIANLNQKTDEKLIAIAVNGKIAQKIMKFRGII